MQSSSQHLVQLVLDVADAEISPEAEEAQAAGWAQPQPPEADSLGLRFAGG